MAAADVQQTVQRTGMNDGAAAGTAVQPAAPGAAAAAPSAAPLAPVAWPSRTSCLYQSCYCEENIFCLARQLVDQLPAAWRLFAVFISNHPHKSVPLWRQRSAAAPSLPVLWDYHVLLLAQLAGQPPLVLDLDSTLPFPCSLREYRHAALLGDDSSLAPQYRRCYRVVPARLFLTHFASDRSHMVGPSGQGWLAPPPPWPCLAAQSGAANTLPAYLDFSEVGQAGPGSDGGDTAGQRAPAEEAGQQGAEQQRQQQQQDGWQAAGSQRQGGAERDAGLALPSETGPPFGIVLREPAFLRLCGVDA